jgi:NADPH2:quinone reductase
VRAVRFTTYGSPDVLHVEQVDQPSARAGEVLVKVCAVGINRIDVATVSGALKSRLPMTPGRDFAGIIADGPEEGTEVWASGAGFGVSRDGAAAEYVAVPRSWLAIKPMNLSMGGAAASGIPFLVAYAALVDAGGIRRGETLVLTGAEGAVGNAAIQIAHLHGACVIGVQRTGRSSGADHVVDITKQDLGEAVRSITGGRGADLVFDVVGGDRFQPALGALRTGGRQIAIASPGRPSAQFDLVGLYRRQLSLHGVDTLDFSGERCASILDALHQAFVAGDLRAPRVCSCPLEAARSAYHAVGHGSAVRHVLLPH